MATPPLRTEISDTYPNPSDAVARIGFGKLYDYVTGLLGNTGNAPEARTALGAAKSGANSDLTTLNAIVGFGNTSTAHVTISTAGNVGINTTANTNAILDIQSTSKGVRLPMMTTTQKNAITNTEALLVWDTTLKSAFINKGTGWGPVGGAGATGGGNDQVFIENDQTITTDYTLGAGKNALTAGPVTINTGVVVTIPTGQVWSIV